MSAWILLLPLGVYIALFVVFRLLFGSAKNAFRALFVLSFVLIIVAGFLFYHDFKIVRSFVKGPQTVLFFEGEKILSGITVEQGKGEPTLLSHDALQQFQVSSFQESQEGVVVSIDADSLIQGIEGKITIPESSLAFNQTQIRDMFHSTKPEERGIAMVLLFNFLFSQPERIITALKNEHIRFSPSPYLLRFVEYLPADALVASVKLTER